MLRLLYTSVVHLSFGLSILNQFAPWGCSVRMFSTCVRYVLWVTRKGQYFAHVKMLVTGTNLTPFVLTGYVADYVDLESNTVYGTGYQN
jgi:hypothetical protein